MATDNEPILDSSATTIGSTYLESKEIEKRIPQDLSVATVETDYSQYTLKWRPWRQHITNFATIVAADYRGAGTDADPFLVTWLLEDPENPKTYNRLAIWSITFLISFISLSIALASSAYSGAMSELMEKFNSSKEVTILGLSLMVLGYAIGPLVWGPMSEVYGRRYVFATTMIMYTLFTSVMIASPNMASIIVFRFLAGTFGSAALVVPGGQIADIFPVEIRGLGIGAFCAAPFLGPALGPIIGGYLGAAAGWKWLFGLLAIYAGVVTIAAIVLVPETYAPILLRRRAATLSEVTGRKYLSLIDSEKPLVMKELVRTALIRPWALLFREPIVFVITIYMSCVYGTLYMTFAAFPIMFQQMRGWSPGEGGLAFLGILGGFAVGLTIVCFDNVRFVRLLKAARGHPAPEVRLPASIFGGGMIIIGLAWLAATNDPQIHWASPILAGVPFGAGLVLVFVCLGNYLVDAYVVYAASVIAASGTIRSLFGAAFPLFTPKMFENIGIHWGVAVPGFIALACFPFPIYFYYKGPQLRKRCVYAAEAARILEMMKPAQEEESQSSSNEDANNENIV